jgi:putative transposase
VEELEGRRRSERHEAFKPGPEGQTLQSTLRRGWYWGSDAFREKLLALRQGKEPRVPKSRDYRSSQQERDHSEARARRIVTARLQKDGLTDADLAARPGNDPLKVELASEIWENTSVSQQWIAARLRMGSAGNVSLQLHRRRKQPCKK